MTHVHLIGIGGSGISAIAWVLVEKGYSVSGSDRNNSPLLPALQQAGVTIHLGHRAENVQGADLVLRSSAIPEDNPEVIAARAAGIPVYKRADFLGRLMSEQYGIAVAGSHGKTTTTAMLAWMLTSLGQDPTFILGGISKNLGVNAHAGQGAAFVIEADEYDHMFLGLTPQLEVITNIEHDHPDIYPTPEDYRQAFHDFAALLPTNGVLLACADDPAATEILHTSPARHWSYALQAPADYQAHDLRLNSAGGFTFTACISSQPAAQIDLQIPGQHNVSNALAAFAVADICGLSHAGAAQALSSFSGTGRRFEICGTVAGITVVDDYAHHPTEIRTTLSAARSRFPGRRIWAVWQPHTYSRVQMLFSDFVSAFNDADEVIVTEVYAAREPAQNFSAAQLVEAMHRPSAHFIPALPAVSTYLTHSLRRGDVLLVLSAGDANQISTQVLAALQERMESNV